MNEEFGPNIFAIDVLCDENGFVALPFRRMEDEGVMIDWGDGEPETLKGSSMSLAEHRYNEPKTWHRIIASCDDWSKVLMVAVKSEKSILERIAPQNPVFKARSCTWRFLTPFPAMAGMLVWDWTNPVEDADGQYIFREYDINVAKSSFEYAMCFFGRIEEVCRDLFSKIKSTSFEGAFKACTIKCELYGLFDGQSDAETFASCFEEAKFSSQKNVPPFTENQFKSCINAKDFSKAFKDSNLAYIPEGLFNECRSAETFRSCFYGTKMRSLPRGSMFEDCTKATEFHSCFSHCENLEVVNEGLFSGTDGRNFSWCFSHCNSLNSVKTPFAECENAETFYGCFNECRSLMAIDGRIFMDAKNAKDFGACFEACQSIRFIPDTLFTYAVSAEDFDSVFKECYSITSIPKGLFSKCPNAMHFGGAFNKCISLEVVNLDVFRGCKMADGFEACFQGCIELSNVPPNLFSYCTSATSFKRCFEGCVNLVDWMRIAIFSKWVDDARDFISKNASFASNQGTVVLVPAGSKTERAFREEERESKSLKVSSIHFE